MRKNRKDERRFMDLQNTVVTEISGVVTVYSEKGRFQKMENRKCYGLSLCMNGQITYTQNGRDFVSDPGKAIVLPMGQSYEIRGDKTGFFPVINFYCRDFLCDEIQVIDLHHQEQLLKDYEQLQKLYLFQKNRAKIFSVFYEMLHKISASNTPKELEPALKMIDREYHSAELNNALLAQVCNISEVYFRKLFVKYFQTSPKRFVTELRMQKAKQLLMEGSMKISAISEACGFANVYHFCRLFKQYVGVTPSEYRKENQINEF